MWKHLSPYCLRIIHARLCVAVGLQSSVRRDSAESEYMYATKAGNSVAHHDNDAGSSSSSELGCSPLARRAHPLARVQTSPPAIPLQGGVMKPF